jgi:hypothetical protein
MPGPVVVGLGLCSSKSLFDRIATSAHIAGKAIPLDHLACIEVVSSCEQLMSTGDVTGLRLYSPLARSVPLQREGFESN